MGPATDRPWAKPICHEQSGGGVHRNLSRQLTETRLRLADNAAAARLSGKRDEHLRTVERELGVTIIPRGTELVVCGEAQAVDQAVRVLEDLRGLSERKPFISRQEVQYALRLAREGGDVRLEDIQDYIIYPGGPGRDVRPRSLGQRLYVEAIRRHSLVFGIGPAGTGKTFLAVAMGVAALKTREVRRLVLTRPAVEAGEKLGFLPGDLREKVDPYLRPLYDALHDILGVEQFQRHVERGLIEVVPLAYMRGRTLEEAFIILDEAQNTTPQQMKMFLTRMGIGSRVVVTGDLTQIDLPPGQRSGLAEAREVLASVEGIAFVTFTEADVMRHELVQKVINAYAEYERGRASAAGSSSPGVEAGDEDVGR